MNQKFAHIAFILVGVTVGIVLSNIHLNIYPKQRKSAAENVFVLGVTVKFKSVEDKDGFKDLFRPVAEYVAKYELDTLSYEMMDSDKEPTQIYILERYRTKKAYLEVHRQSKEFLSFREKFQIMIAAGAAVLDGHSYIESGIGFV